jgi:hypothetical protein
MRVVVLQGCLHIKQDGRVQQKRVIVGDVVA